MESHLLISLILTVFPLFSIILSYKRYFQTKYRFYHYFGMLIVITTIFSLGSIILSTLDLPAESAQIWYNLRLTLLFLHFPLIELLLEEISNSKNQIIALISLFLSLIPISIAFSSNIVIKRLNFAWNISWDFEFVAHHNRLLLFLFGINALLVLIKVTILFVNKLSERKDFDSYNVKGDNDNINAKGEYPIKKPSIFPYTWLLCFYSLLVLSFLLELLSNGLSIIFPLFVLFLGSFALIVQYFRDPVVFSLYKGELLYILLIFKKNGLPMFDYDFLMNEIVSSVPVKTKSARFAHIRYLLSSSSLNFEIYAGQGLESGFIQKFDIRSFNINIYTSNQVRWILISKPQAHNHFELLKHKAEEFERKFMHELPDLEKGFVATEEMKKFCREQWEKL